MDQGSHQGCRLSISRSNPSGICLAMFETKVGLDIPVPCRPIPEFSFTFRLGALEISWMMMIPKLFSWEMVGELSP